MRRSTYFRIFLAMSLIVFISFSLLGGLSTILSYRRTFSERRDTMVSTLHETSRYIETFHLANGTGPDDMDLHMSLVMISRVTNLDFLLTNAEGLIVSCTDYTESKLNLSVSADLLSSFSKTENVAVVMSTLGDVYSVRRPITGMPLTANAGGQARICGYLFVTSDMAAHRQEWKNFTSAFILLALSVMTVAFIVLYIASKRQIEPLNEIAETARRFARGDYDARVSTTPGRKDEISQLTEAFNYMADSIQQSEERRRDFIANLSHELKTPMTVISGFAEGLLDGTIKHDREEHYLKIISSETKRLSRLVKSMLDVSTLGEADPKAMVDNTFDITEIAALTLVSLESRINAKGLTVETKIPEDAVITKGNKDSITQVMYNLLDNAIKYSPNGEKIMLELWRQDKRVYVSVSNHGATIPSNELPYIFHRFHKVDKSRGIDREGVGLGLYIAKSILDLHNEDIFVTSSGGMTKFMFTLTVAN